MDNNTPVSDALLVKADRVASHLRSAASYVRGEQLPGWFDARFLKEASWVIVDLLALVAAARRGVADTARSAEIIANLPRFHHSPHGMQTYSGGDWISRTAALLAVRPLPPAPQEDDHG